MGGGGGASHDVVDGFGTVVVVAAGRGRVARNTLQEATAWKIGMLRGGGRGGKSLSSDMRTTRYNISPCGYEGIH